MMQLCPPICGQAQGNCGGIEGVHLVGYEEVLDIIPLLPRQFHHTICKLLKDSTPTCLIGFAEVAPCDALSVSKVMECKLEWGERNDEVTQPFPV